MATLLPLTQYLGNYDNTIYIVRVSHGQHKRYIFETDGFQLLIAFHVLNVLQGHT